MTKNDYMTKCDSYLESLGIFDHRIIRNIFPMLLRMTLSMHNKNVPKQENHVMDKINN